MAEASELGPTLTLGDVRARGFEETVREYLCVELTNHAEPEREAILARAEALLKEVQP